MARPFSSARACPPPPGTSRLPAPSDQELERILTRIIRKVAQVVSADEAVERALEDDAFAELQAADPPEDERGGPRYRVPWAELLRKVFSLDVLACPECGGRMELLAFIAEAAVAKKILDHLGLASTAPPLARAVTPDQADNLGPEYGGADPRYED